MVSVLGITIPDEHRTLCFLFCSGGIYFFYIVQGYASETLKNKHALRYGWFVTLFQCVAYALMAYVDRLIRGSAPRKAHIRDYLKIGFLQVTTLALSTLSLEYLNVPTQMMFKSSKLLPVMLVKELCFNKRSQAIQYIAALLLVTGLVVFTLGDSKVTPNFNLYGVGLVCGALLADAFIGNVQEEILKNHGATSDEMVLYSHAVGGVYLLAAAAATGDLTAGAALCAQQPSVVTYLVIYSAFGFVGVCFVMATIGRFGCVLTVTVTSVRKALSILLSFLLFPKPFAALHAVAFIFFAAGLTAETLASNPAARDRLAAVAVSAYARLRLLARGPRSRWDDERWLQRISQV